MKWLETHQGQLKKKWPSERDTTIKDAWNFLAEEMIC